MAWLYDLRDSVQEILEWVSHEVPCTCLSRSDEVDGVRCRAHRAHVALGALYRHGLPTRRLFRPMTPRWVPAHEVLVAHDWTYVDVGHGARERVHNPDRCRIWCGDCGTIAPGRCRLVYPHDGTRSGRYVERGDVLFWWGDYEWSESLPEDLHDSRPCTELIRRLFELRPGPPADIPSHALPTWDPTVGWDNGDDVGVRPPPLRRAPFRSSDGLAGSSREGDRLPQGQHRRSS